MEINEIKKALYKQNPQAKFLLIKDGVVTYDTTIEIKNDNKPIPSFKTLLFKIPVTDMGEAEFLREMNAKYLIRWLVNENKVSELCNFCGSTNGSLSCSGECYK